MTQKTRHTTQIMNDEYQAFEWIFAINSPWQIDRLTFSRSWRKWSDFINITNCCWKKKKKIIHRGKKGKRSRKLIVNCTPECECSHMWHGISTYRCSTLLPLGIWVAMIWLVTSLAGKEWLELWKDFIHNHATLFFKCKLHLH